MSRVQVLSRISREGSIVHQLEALREENKDLLCKYTAAQVRGTSSHTAIPVRSGHPPLLVW